MNDTPIMAVSFARASVAVLVLLAMLPAALAQQPGKPPPTYSEISYGAHERNVLDFWQAESTRATPFVLYIHGGGFANGSKDSLKAAALKDLLAAGISVVAVNYRYYHQAPLPASLHDCRRALQFVRSKASEWNLDKSRAAATGGSAGAIASMYLAFHDDIADPNSIDPIARESTRLTCVATTAGQTTLDIEWWATKVPGWPKGEGVKRDGHAARRWGVTDNDAYRTLVHDASALHLISRDDPPIWMNYKMAPDAEFPTDAKQATNWRIHHVTFGVALKKRMDVLGVEANLRYPGSKSAVDAGVAGKRYNSLTHFLIAKLKAGE